MISPSQDVFGTILVVDDDGINRRVFSDLLARAGHRTQGAETGHAALDAMDRRKFDLVLLDLMMPGMDGLEVLEHMRHKRILGSTQVIVLSAAIDRETRLRCLELGALDFLAKPVEKHELLARVRNAIRLQHALSALQSREVLLLEQVAERDRALNSLVQSIPGVILRVDSTGMINYSSAVEGPLSAEEICGTRYGVLAQPGDVDSLETALARTLSTGERATVEVRSSNAIVPGAIHEHNIAPLGDTLGQGAAIVVQDVTERRAEGARLAALMRALPVLLMDLTLRYSPAELSTPRGVSAALASRRTSVRFQGDLAKVLGLKIARTQPRDIARWVVDDVLLEEDHDAIVREIAEAIESGRREFSCDIRARHSDGTPHTFHVHAAIFTSPAVVSVCLVAIDVEEQRALTNQLHQAQKLEAIGRLAGGIAHDFNNVLGAIVGFAGFVREALTDDDPMASDVDEILGAAERGVGLSRQLLALARNQPTKAREIDVVGAVQGATTLLERMLGAHVHLEVEGDLGMQWIMSDPARVDQLVMNLCINARDAMPNGGRLRLGVESVRARDREGRTRDCVRLTVTDEGTGMDEATLARIFDPFFSTKTSGAGTGLGLSICKSIVDGLGGTITADSALGRGTTMIVDIPRCMPPMLPMATSEVSGVLPVGSTRGRVVLVEDSEALRVVSARTLRAAGYEVFPAEDGEEAAKLLASLGASIDAVVSDANLPKGNGPEVLALARQHAPSCALVLVSGYVDERIRSGILPTDASVLWKPFTSADLVKTVKAAVRARRLEQPERAA